MAAIDELSIRITIDTSSVQGRIDTVKKQLTLLSNFAAQRIPIKIDNTEAKNVIADTKKAYTNLSDSINTVCKITLDTSDATRNINLLNEKLVGLGKAASEASDVIRVSSSLSDLSSAAAGLQNAVSAINSLAASFDNFKSGYTEELNNMAMALSRVNTAVGSFKSESENISSAASQISNLVNVFKNFNSVDVSKIQNAAKALRLLGEAAQSIGTKGTQVDKLASGLSILDRAINNFSNYVSQVNSFTVAMENLKTGMEQINNALTGLDVKAANAFNQLAMGLRKLQEISFDQSYVDQIIGATNAVQQFVTSINSGIDDAAAQKFIKIGYAIEKCATAYRNIKQARDSAGTLGAKLEDVTSWEKLSQNILNAATSFNTLRT